jgi:hypothetical protein
VTCEIGAKVPCKKFQAYSVAVDESTDVKDITEVFSVNWRKLKKYELPVNSINHCKPL